MFSFSEKGGTGGWGLIIATPPKVSLPQFTGVATGDASSDTSVIPVPSSRQPGDMLVAITGGDGFRTTTWPMDWTKLGDFIHSGSQCFFGVAWKISDGTETTVTVTLSGSEQHAFGCISISGVHPSQAPEVDGEASGTSNPGVDAGLITPTWGQANNLYLAMGAHDSGNMDFIDPPANYQQAFWRDRGTLFGGGVTINYRGILNSTSEDPGDMNMEFSTEWVAAVVAVRGKAGASFASEIRISEAGGDDPRPNSVRITEDGQFRATE